MKDALDEGVGHLEDGGDTLPAAAVAQAVCGVGTVDVTVDSCGNPLDVGREHRLFTPRQRIALAVRDGGCVWPRCTMPASYGEAHHIDEWAAHGGRTDVDRGVLLCRYHHMSLHHRGYRIRRDGTGPLMLHPPEGPPVELRSRSPLRWRWEPPPDRVRLHGFAPGRVVR
ncbi:HNH endonuclease signature motif containing protein [Microbacterium marinilacus]|nr:HNH endonuclease signature motif containing protein [Microbacterium marinilacus]MBY0689422.1 HNH endonuclease [Microbacterium marinilacus]